jgi:polyisoprenoid-binding protein YceI
VAIPPGSYRLGPGDGILSVRTQRTGAAAKAGHNLLLHVTAWEATLTIGEEPAGSSLELSADGASLRVREGTGGMQELGDDDIENIEQTIDDEVLMRESVTFRSTEVTAAAGDGLAVRGDLTLLGATRPLAFDVSVGNDDTLSAVAVVKQSDWGMKPYSALFGALKVVDEVEVGIEAALPGAAGAPSAQRVVRARVGVDAESPARDDFPVLGAWISVAAVWGVEILGALLWIN